MTSEKAPAKEAEDNGDPNDLAGSILKAASDEAQVFILHFNSSGPVAKVTQPVKFFIVG